MSNFSPHYILVVSFFLFLVDPPSWKLSFTRPPSPLLSPSFTILNHQNIGDIFTATTLFEYYTKKSHFGERCDHSITSLRSQSHMRYFKVIFIHSKKLLIFDGFCHLDDPQKFEIYEGTHCLHIPHFSAFSLAFVYRNGVQKVVSSFIKHVAHWLWHNCSVHNSLNFSLPLLFCSGHFCSYPHSSHLSWWCSAIWGSSSIKGVDHFRPADDDTQKAKCES